MDVCPSYAVYYELIDLLLSVLKEALVVLTVKVKPLSSRLVLIKVVILLYSG